jgi:3-isopropylmalate/(R)-2-methylmalate dehydratase large subunit
MVLSSQCIMQPKPKKMRITINGKLGKGVVPKDVPLFILSQISASGATGYFIEFAGEVFENMSMEGRMTVCNLSIEMGARGGMVAPDETTFNYLKGRDLAPKGEAWDKALAYWKTLKTDADAKFDLELSFSADQIEPQITYGTNPGLGTGISKAIPLATDVKDGEASYKKSLAYMGFAENEKIIGKQVDYVFLGSCTNASIVKGRKKAANVTAWLVPGSHIVEKQIQEEGILDILTEAGFMLRQPGCSACLAMNDDKIPAGKYAVSTSNRNFEGRQGPGARTMLASPLVAAAAAVTGVVTDPRELL